MESAGRHLFCKNSFSRSGRGRLGGNWAGICFAFLCFFQGAVHFETDCNVSESIVTSSGERLDKNMCCPYYTIWKWIGRGLWGMWVRARIEAAGRSAGV